MPFPNAADWQIFDAKGRRKYLNAAERSAVLREADRCDARTRALCRVMAFTGCRVSEALELTTHHLDAELHAVILRTLKRRKLVYRRVPIPPDLSALLGGLPTGPDGRFFSMHRATAWRRTSAVMARAGVIGPMASCRGFRHGYGIHAISSGVPAPLLRLLLGHADIATTLIYVDAVGADERQLVERMWV